MNSLCIYNEYNNFHWNCYTPKIRQIEKLIFLGISRCKFNLGFKLNLNLYRGIWLFGFGGFRGCSIFSGIFHTLHTMNLSCIAHNEYTQHSSTIHCEQQNIPLWLSNLLFFTMNSLCLQDACRMKASCITGWMHDACIMHHECMFFAMNSLCVQDEWMMRWMHCTQWIQTTFLNLHTNTVFPFLHTNICFLCCTQTRVFFRAFRVCTMNAQWMHTTFLNLHTNTVFPFLLTNTVFPLLHTNTVFSFVPFVFAQWMHTECTQHCSTDTQTLLHTEWVYLI